MITVSIAINGAPIYTRSAVNVGDCEDGSCLYEVDTGEHLQHFQEHGAVALVRQMLDTIHETGATDGQRDTTR